MCCCFNQGSAPCLDDSLGFCDHLVVGMIGLCQTFCGEFSQETLSLKGAHFPED